MRTRSIRFATATVTLAGALALGSVSAASEPLSASAGTGFQPMTPTRLVDTRAGLGAVAGRTQPGQPFDVQVAGLSGVPSSGVGAVALNLTVTDTAWRGYLAAWPAGTAFNGTSNLNFPGGATQAIQALVGLGADGKVTLMSVAPAHVVVDVVGWWPIGGGFEAIGPARLADTRAIGQTDPLPVTVAGTHTMLAVEAAVLNVTAVPRGTPWFLTVAPSTTSPNASTVNFGASEPISGFAVTGLSFLPSGLGGVYVHGGGGADVVVDHMGYLMSGFDFHRLAPTRLLDTRTGPGPIGRIPAGGSVTLKVAGVSGIPAHAKAVSLNVTSTGATAPGFVTVHPEGETRPTASTLNFAAGQTIANSAIAKVGRDGSVTLYSMATTDLVVDVSGWWE